MAHHGPNNSGGEWGYDPLPMPAASELPRPACYCGKNGFLDRWVSGWAFARNYVQYAGVDLTQPVTADPRSIMAAVRAGDRLTGLA